ncbi:hypothetical protein NPIL_539831 [Nephila pilipes]|uniref:Uncharacterized protein n=1 Tax=Nephila pilipes TaxID=299642 RepID=A0A8X6PUB5_NEPPI|nr:hypothetical protein NPIL_539831 [Nephila pilipes]
MKCTLLHPQHLSITILVQNDNNEKKSSRKSRSAIPFTSALYRHSIFLHHHLLLSLHSQTSDLQHRPLGTSESGSATELTGFQFIFLLRKYPTFCFRFCSVCSYRIPHDLDFLKLCAPHGQQDGVVPCVSAPAVVQIHGRGHHQR